MNATETLYSLPFEEAAPRPRPGVPAKSSPPNVHRSLMVFAPPPVTVPKAPEQHSLHPQVPPESPLPMQARAFEFVGIRDLTGFLLPFLRPHAQPAPAGIESQLPAQR